MVTHTHQEKKRGKERTVMGLILPGGQLFFFWNRSITAAFRVFQRYHLIREHKTLIDIYMNFHAAYLFSYTASFYCYEWEILTKDSSLNTMSVWLDHEYVDKFINKILSVYKLRVFFMHRKLFWFHDILCLWVFRDGSREGPLTKVFLSKL